MTQPGLRRAVLGASVLVGAIVLGAGLDRWRERRAAAGGMAGFVPPEPEPAAAPARSPRTWPLLPERPEEFRYHIPERAAPKYFGQLSRPIAVYDPWVAVRDVGHRSDVFEWPEHPNGQWTWRSNAEGLREDRDLADLDADLRILVAGDSQTCGVLDNQESYANVLERALAGERPGRSVQVLNAGYGGYTFTNYIGTLHRFRHFAPAVVVVGVFLGNDFSELVPLRHRTEWTRPPARTAAQNRIRRRAMAETPAALGAGLHAEELFRNWPEEVEPTLAEALRLTAELQAVCGALGARLVVVLLPAPTGLDWPGGHEQVARGRALLELEPADARRVDDLGDRYAAGLTELDLDVADLRPVFAAEPRPPYWRRDLHLDVRGHALVAAALRPLVARE